MKNCKLNPCEPIAVADTFVTHVVNVHLVGDNVRLVLAAEAVGIFDGKVEHAVVAKIVGSRADMLEVAAAIVRGCQGADATDEAFRAFLDAPTRRQ